MNNTDPAAEMEPIVKEFEEATDSDNDELTILCNTMALRLLVQHVRTLEARNEVLEQEKKICSKALDEIQFSVCTKKDCDCCDLMFSIARSTSSSLS